MKKMLKITFILVIMLIIQFQTKTVYGKLQSTIEADGGGSSSSINIIDTNEYEPYKSYEDYNEALFEQKLKLKAKTVVAIIRNIGIVVAVIALMVIGIKTMVLSAEEKAAYKQALPGYLLGVFMIAAISAIPSLIYNVVNGW